MDEMTFQQELQELKQRVSEMANSSTPASSATQLSGFMLANAVQNDMFVAQLRDVTARLDIMQSTSRNMPQEWREQQAQSPPTQHLNDETASSWARNSELEALHTMLVDTHNATFERISRLEQTVSDLQSNITFTPASSETTIDDLLTSHDANVREPAPNTDQPVHAASVQRQSHDRPASLSQILGSTCSEPSVAPEHFMAICPPNFANLARPAELPDILNAADSANKPEVPQFNHDDRVLPAITSRDKEIDNLYETLRLQTTNFEAKMAAKDADLLHFNHCRLAAEEASQITRTDLEERIRSHEDEIARLHRSVGAAEENLETIARRTSGHLESQDKTIGRLTHDLKQCEASRHHFMTKYVDENYRFKWLEQRKLQSEQFIQKQLEDCERALAQCEANRDADIGHAIRSKDDELEKLHVFCQEKDAIAWKQEELIAQGAAILQERDAEIDRLHAALAECQRSRDDARDQCGRFKRSIRERKDEIEDLKYDLNEERNRRCRLQDMMRKDADMIKAKAKDVRFSDDDEQQQQPATPFAQATEAARSGKSRGGRPLWTPQPIRANARLPHEENRASVWEVGNYSNTKHRFGSASPIAQRRQQDVRHDVRSKQDSRNDEEVQLSRIADTENVSQVPRGACESRPSESSTITTVERREPHSDISPANFSLSKSRPANQKAHRNTSSKMVIGDRPSHDGLRGMAAQAPTNDGTSENRRYDRHALPLDVTWLPPLPAPVSVDRVNSVPDLRAGRQSHSHGASGHGAISKPASMLDFRPSQQTQQTYHAPSVETEAESAEDQGGSSLLEA